MKLIAYLVTRFAPRRRMGKLQAEPLHLSEILTPEQLERFPAAKR